MNVALCRIVFISVHPFGTYVSRMCRKSDAVGAAAAGMVRRTKNECGITPRHFHCCSSIWVLCERGVPDI